jgi:hypothetical protein
MAKSAAGVSVAGLALLLLVGAAAAAPAKGGDPSPTAARPVCLTAADGSRAGDGCGDPGSATCLVVGAPAAIADPRCARVVTLPAGTPAAAVARAMQLLAAGASLDGVDLSGPAEAVDSTAVGRDAREDTSLQVGAAGTAASRDADRSVLPVLLVVAAGAAITTAVVLSPRHA